MKAPSHFLKVPPVEVTTEAAEALQRNVSKDEPEL